MCVEGVIIVVLYYMKKCTLLPPISSPLISFWLSHRGHKPKSISYPGHSSVFVETTILSKIAARSVVGGHQFDSTTMFFPKTRVLRSVFAAPRPTMNPWPAQLLSASSALIREWAYTRLSVLATLMFVVTTNHAQISCMGAQCVAFFSALIVFDHQAQVLLEGRISFGPKVKGRRRCITAHGTWWQVGHMHIRWRCHPLIWPWQASSWDRRWYSAFFADHPQVFMDVFRRRCFKEGLIPGQYLVLSNIICQQLPRVQCPVTLFPEVCENSGLWRSCPRLDDVLANHGRHACKGTGKCQTGKLP